MQLEGKSIRLRDWELDDLARYRAWNDGHYPWMDFNGPYFPKKTLATIDATIEQTREQIIGQNWPSPRTRLVIAEKNSNQFIGSVSWYWQSEATNWKSIGIAIYDDHYWSKGIGYEALRLWIDYLFQQDESLVRLDLRTWSGNKGMIRLAEKLGFLQEACFRKARILNGVYYDSIGMGILREEWLK